MAVKQEARRFSSDASGSVAIIFALLSTALFGVVALAVDMSRAYNVTTKLSAALDAAALAGAKKMDNGGTNAEIQAIAKAYFDAQTANFAVGGVSMSNFEAKVDRSKSTVSASVDVNMNTLIAGVLGKDNMRLDRNSTVTYKTRNVELSMVLDVTGSMNYDVSTGTIANGEKLDEMKTAAKDVLDTLLDDAPSDAAIRVAVVPWSTSVNAGTLAPAVSGGVSVDNCVVERTGGDAIKDTAPSNIAPLPAITTTPAPGNYEYYNCTSAPVIPLSGRNKKNDLRDAIDALAPMGGTAGHIGTAWGWYTLSPAWSGIWPGGSTPNAYNPTSTIKSVLLMSDGEFNISWRNGSSTDMVAMSSDSYAQFQQLCTAMKAKQIVVYTVGFGIDAVNKPTALQQLKDCATSDNHFFQAVNGSDLKKAFRSIATQLTSMAITR